MSQQGISRWLPFVIVGILALVGVSLIVYGAQSAGGIGPRLQLDRDQIDFGDQHFNSTVRATFKATNVGDGTLTLNVPKTATVVQGC